MDNKKVGDSIGGTIPSGCYTVAQAARKVGRHQDTLTRWRRSGLYVPSKWKQYGELRVGLYTEADLVALRAIASRTKPGRKAVGDC